MRGITSQSAEIGGAKRKSRRFVFAATTATFVLALAMPAIAQQSKSNSVEEVIVTARKRAESILTVPVVATAVTGAQLTKLALPADLATIVPSLEIGEAVESSGVRVFLRGIGTTSGDPGVDQSVSLNVDGLQLTNGLAYRSGLFDLGRIEVLKGPQGLFYGKNSPGGVISLYSADPTDRLEVKAGVGYEIESLETQTDFVISGPVTDELKLRLAARYSKSAGFFINPATTLAGTGALQPNTDRLDGTKSGIVRATALWNPTPKLDARLKANYVSDKELWAGQEQFVSCPDGTGAPAGRLPYLGGGEDCKQDRTVRAVGLDPSAFPGNPALNVGGLPNNGVPSRETTQMYGTLELNYHATDSLTLTSLTAYYHVRSKSYINTANTTYAGSPAASEQDYRRRDVTEELRATSDFTGPINFTAGGFYQDADVSNLSTQRGNILQATPALRGLGIQSLHITTYSLFGQLRWRVFDRFELAGGARWSDETRTDTPFNLITGVPVPVAIAIPRIHSNNVKPEFTATYRPLDTLTLFASYKTGYKSGSLNIATGASPGQNNAYGNEYVKGAEVGVKSRLFDRRLAFDFAGYDYKYSGLQVTTLVAGAGLLPVARTLNAGSAKVYGLELDSAYSPPEVDGLKLSVTANWNHARFNQLDNVPCYGGQEISEGCNELLNTSTGFYTGQNLNGIPLIDAPEWSGSFGFDYEWPIGNDLVLSVNNSNHFMSKYLTALGRRPDLYQSASIKMDLGFTLKGTNDRWEIAVQGKDLNNALTRSTCALLNAQGGLLFGGEVTGGTTRGPAGIDEVLCYVDPGREVWLTLTVRPFN